MSGKGLIVGFVLAVALATGASAQTDVAGLRSEAQARFDVVTLTGGVALVPKTAVPGVRLVEVRNGVVSINGEAVSAADLRTRLGADADVVLRVSYLDAAGLAALAGATGGAAVAPATPQAPEAGQTPGSWDDDSRDDRRERRRSGSRNQKEGIVRFGGTVTVEKDERVSGDVVVMGGSAHILGTVEDELVVIGGKADVQGTVDGDVSVVGGALELGPESVVRGDVSVAGGSIRREPGARVDGKIDEVGVGDDGMAIGDLSKIRPRVRTAWNVGSFLGALWRSILLVLLTLVVVALGRRYARPISARVAAEPVRSGLTGLLAEVLFVPVLVLTVVVLAVSIIGIPFLLLLPFALVLVVVAALLGFSGVALTLGRAVLDRVGYQTESPYVQAAAGVVAALTPMLLARALGLLGSGFFGGFLGGTLLVLGIVLEYLAWTVGLGATIWVLRQNRGRVPREDPPVNVPPPSDPQAPPADPEVYV